MSTIWFESFVCIWGKGVFKTSVLCFVFIRMAIIDYHTFFLHRMAVIDCCHTSLNRTFNLRKTPITFL